MTELMNATRLRQMAGLADQSALALPPTVPVLRWAVEEGTGRPISHWILADFLVA